MREFALLLFAAAFVPGPQVSTFFSDIDDTDQPYALYVPRSYDGSKPYPLVVSLHGAYSNHRVNLRRVFGRGNLPGETDAEASRYFPGLKDIEFIVVSPFARGTMGYQGIPEKDVYDVLAEVKRRFNIDEDRIYLTGLSMGGGGTLWLGLTRPDTWAAIAPVCPAAPDGTDDLAPNALHVPVHLFHGDQDPVVPVSVSRQWHRRLLEIGAPAEYVEFPGVRHNSWDPAYRDANIFEWFSKFRRVRSPERVRFVSSSYKYSSAYWVRFDALTPGALASIDAKFAGRDRLEVITSNLDGFTLELKGHPLYSERLQIVIDGAPVKQNRPTSFSFRRTDAGWQAGKHATRAKRPGLEGPMREAVASRHLYVYGTADSPNSDEMARRRLVAEQAAEWRGATRLTLDLQVRADRDVREQDLAESNLVLFGTAETNRLIARFSGELPIALNAGAADYGLLYAYPAGQRYVLINSGLPLLTGVERLRGQYRFMPPLLAMLLPRGDYMLFKGSLENVLAEGRFDNDWKLAEDAAARLSATGAVMLKSGK